MGCIMEYLWCNFPRTRGSRGAASWNGIIQSLVPVYNFKDIKWGTCHLKIIQTLQDYFHPLHWYFSYSQFKKSGFHLWLTIMRENDWVLSCCSIWLWNPTLFLTETWWCISGVDVIYLEWSKLSLFKPYDGISSVTYLASCNSCDPVSKLICSTFLGGDVRVHLMPFSPCIFEV